MASSEKKDRSWVLGLGLGLVLPLVMPASATQEDTRKNMRTAEHRLTLASHMIQRLSGKSRLELDAELEDLQARFLENVDQQLANDANAFFQRVMSVYRKANSSPKAVDEDVHRKRYETKTTELQSFHEAYLELVEERGDAARKVWDEQKYIDQVARARNLAGKRQYEEAYALADGAYHQLIHAVKTLRDRETVEYRLEFETPADEYQYEIRRFASQKMLLDMMVAEKKPQKESISVIEQFVEKADSKARVAAELAEAGKYELALSQQEEAVDDLTKAMRLVGVYF